MSATSLENSGRWHFTQTAKANLDEARPSQPVRTEMWRGRAFLTFGSEISERIRERYGRQTCRTNCPLLLE